MTFEESWTAIKQAAEENRHELVLSGPTISKAIAATGLDPTLFNLQNLNYLNISQTCLEELPEEIEKLINLTTLVLHSNKLSKLPTSVDKLTKLKVLDCSRNTLSSLPVELGNLPQLCTINLSSNELQSIPSQIGNIKLCTLDLSNNKFETFPDICYVELVYLSEVYVNGNDIKEIPININHLRSLKIINMADNAISVIPGELADCTKLKELHLKGNRVIDKRLSKLIDQCRTKQILEYIKLHCPRTSTDFSTGNKPRKGKKGHKLSENEDISNAVESLSHKIKVLKVTNDVPVIKVTQHVKNVRPYIVGCVVRNLSFTEDSFKKFIQFQTKLHDGICEKRNAATIATHDLKLIAPGDLTYTAKPPTELEIRPLMRSTCYTGAALFNQLQTEANNLRKEKKRNVYSGIHKYLYLIEGKPLFPCLHDSTDQVISFPPITNSDVTKMSPSTETMFVEVTSTTSYQVCKNVLDQFLKDLAISGLGYSPSNEDTSGYHNVIIEQVKVVDMEGNMKLVYPSRTDLNFEENNLTILRE